MTIPYISNNVAPQRSDSRPRRKQDPSTPTPPPRLVLGERRVKPRLSKPSLDPVLESDQRLSRDIEQMISGDASQVTRKHSLPTLSGRRGETPDETIQLNQSDEVGDGVWCASIVAAEIKTNVIIEDEFTFITELSEYLSIRYNRPASCIVTTLQHGICVQFGGTCAPSYTMKIEALSRDVQTSANKRNIALFQRYMEQSLGIPASRGYLRFVPVAEDYVGWKGNTVAGEMVHEIDREHTLTKHRGSIRAPRRRSSKALRETGNKTAVSTSTLMETASQQTNMPIRVYQSDPEVSNKIAADKTDAGQIKVVKRRKSFIHALFPRFSTRMAGKETEAGDE
ncbi:macrophage migration inhibitory factor [Fusarium longipes]|uniref:L-dopachrome isomerase n=1 Tax=Fusarium longipes TaxID=694270 RepID=A0A395T8Q6_9HYPO|nr:macrophage migration inhibitory factor [Fusarium longipes]